MISGKDNSRLLVLLHLMTMQLALRCRLSARPKSQLTWLFKRDQASAHLHLQAMSCWQAPLGRTASGCSLTCGMKEDSKRMQPDLWDEGGQRAEAA